MDLKVSQEAVSGDLPIIDVLVGHHQLDGRVSSIAASPNMIYVGTVSGDIRVIGRVDGEYLNRRWGEESRPIEGIMFDHQGKMVYATEMNLVVVDRKFTQVLKEYRSVDPLRRFPLNSSDSSDRKKNAPEPRPLQGRLVGKPGLSDHR